jgi:serine protease AprX
MLRKSVSLIVLILAVFWMATVAWGAGLSPNLSTRLSRVSDSTSVGVVIVSFKTTSGLGNSQLDVLRGVGISNGVTLPHLGMVAVAATAGQVRALATRPEVRSIWSNDRLKYMMNQARVLTGVDKVRTDAAFTRLNGGLPVSGRGDFSVVIDDSGIDATHSDLQLGSHVIQNVQVILPDNINQFTGGFTPLVVVENVPNNDTTGHGTHCAGIVAGTGQMSGGLYSGVAPAANIVGVGSGATLLVLNALAGFEYSIANQFTYRIRVMSNSYGPIGGAPFDPNDPILIASKQAHDLNIVVVFAAGNSGPDKYTLSPYAQAPWNIGVAAGTKEGGLVYFSSRGLPKDERCDPIQSPDSCDLSQVGYDAPTITAPGTGREFSSVAETAKFTSDIISVRSKTNLVANGTIPNNTAPPPDAEIPPAYLPFYTQISGTSMATPFIAGTVALMLSADPTLSPDEIKAILQQTATPMPGYQDFEVGSGYVNVYAAVDKVFNRTKNYGAQLSPTFNQSIQETMAPQQNFHIDYSPTASGKTSVNAHSFAVSSGMDVLDALVVVGDINKQVQTIGGATGIGDSLFIELTDPQGHTYDSSLLIPALQAPVMEAKVNNPMPGPWTLEVLGYFGPSAFPIGCDANIVQKHFTLSPAPIDIQGSAMQTDILTALLARRLDAFSDGTFRPQASVTREDLARTLALNVPLRQSLASAPVFNDTSADLEPIAEALTVRGATLRDWNFVPQGLISTSGGTFNPTGTVNRLDLAIALVRALGLDAEAKAKANTPVMAGGQELIDDPQIPLNLRGYVQIALDRGMVEAFPASVQQLPNGSFQALPGPRFEPKTLVTRGVMASKLNLFTAQFAAGN